MDSECGDASRQRASGLRIGEADVPVNGVADRVRQVEQRLLVEFGDRRLASRADNDIDP